MVLEPGVALTLQDVIDQLATSGVARYMLPERLEIVEALPRNPTGKVSKRACVEALRGAGRTR